MLESVGGFAEPPFLASPPVGYGLNRLARDTSSVCFASEPGLGTGSNVDGLIRFFDSTMPQLGWDHPSGPAATSLDGLASACGDAGADRPLGGAVSGVEISYRTDLGIFASRYARVVVWSSLPRKLAPPRLYLYLSVSHALL
jgi:hypothetical protein